ncbi:bifunctional DNA primase/polymerase [Leifsonia aquatica]|uniref:bifunctional DNA primase/polymerase n=1 Tax=Leifsonia aquatica TaxID=144185 RepID=UPI0028A71741|nr:bifunctional DNA primase/polymerase [Leifsonia aquatica]
MMGPAELFAQVAGLPLPEAAVLFAAAGVRVFPCAPGGKAPLTRQGFHDATTDPRRIRSWWRWMPAANIGVPTGTASGIEVVDVDKKTAGSGFAAFERARHMGLVDGWLALVRTPSGGMHAYYPADSQRSQPSWEAAKAHVDFRGFGGYVIVPPSVVQVADGLSASYALVGGPRPTALPVDATALRDLIAPRPAPVVHEGSASTSADAARLAAWVAARGEGERNRGLFWAACRMAEAGASPETTHGTLGAAAERSGLPPQEVAATIRSAYRTTHARLLPAEGEQDEVLPHRAAQVGSQVLL